MQSRLQIEPFSDALAPYFERINAQWINTMFTLEEVDKRVLRHPQTEIIAHGGKIWFAVHPTLGVVGTCALLHKGDGHFELTKMGVIDTARGLKVGEVLLQYVIAQALTMPVQSLFLLTNKDCAAAIHLYEKNGFVHSLDVMRTYGQSYARCNVAMSYPIKS